MGYLKSSVLMVMHSTLVWTVQYAVYTGMDRRVIYPCCTAPQIMRFLETEEMHVGAYGLGLKGTLALCDALKASGLVSSRLQGY